MPESKRYFTDEEFIAAYKYGLRFVTHPCYTPADADGVFGCTPLIALILQELPDFLSAYPLVKMQSRVGGYQEITETKLGISLTKKIKVETEEESYAIGQADPNARSCAMECFHYFSESRGCTMDYVMGVNCGSIRRTVYYNKGAKVIGVSQPGVIGGTEEFKAGYQEGWDIRDALIAEGVLGADTPMLRVELP